MRSAAGTKGVLDTCTLSALGSRKLRTATATEASSGSRSAFDLKWRVLYLTHKIWPGTLLCYFSLDHKPVPASVRGLSQATGYT